MLKNRIFKNSIFFLITFLVLSIPISGRSIELKKESDPSTQLETFLTRRGQLIIKDMFFLGNIFGLNNTQISLEAIVIYEPGQEQYDRPPAFHHQEITAIE